MWDNRPVEQKENIFLVPVKPVTQVNGYECGVACVQTILGTKGLRSNRLSLKKNLRTTRRYGTLSENIKEILGSYGLPTEEKFKAKLSDIETALCKGNLCLVAYQAWGARKYYKKLQSGHYSVVFGFEKDYLWLADPFVKGERVRYKTGIRKIRKTVFEERWMDEDGLDHWMLSV